MLRAVVMDDERSAV